jgi:hypothetical protein
MKATRYVTLLQRRLSAVFAPIAARVFSANQPQGHFLSCAQVLWMMLEILLFMSPMWKLSVALNEIGGAK